MNFRVYLELLFVLLLLDSPTLFGDISPFSDEKNILPVALASDAVDSQNTENEVIEESENQANPRQGSKEKVKVDDTKLSGSTRESIKSSGTDVTELVEVKNAAAQEKYSYAGSTKPDPFVPPIVARSSQGETTAMKSILQKHPVSELTLVGVYGKKNMKALLMTPNNEGMVVEVGDTVGDQGAKVIEIGRNAIRTREFSTASDGTREFFDSELNLGGKEEDQTASTVDSSPILPTPAPSRSPAYRRRTRPSASSLQQRTLNSGT